MSHLGHDQRIIMLEQQLASQANELAILRGQVSFLSQIVADLHETTNILVKKAVNTTGTTASLLVVEEPEKQEQAKDSKVQVVQKPHNHVNQRRIAGI